MQNQPEQSAVSRVAVVTGGSRGIGRAICVQLARQGYHICINYLGNDAAAQETAAQCSIYGNEVMLYKANVAEATQCQQMFAAVLQQFGRIDVLVNNAGVTNDNLLIRMSEAEFEQVLHTNVTSAFLCTKCVARTMMKQRYGRVVNISSVVGVVGNAGQVNYAASKAALIGFTKSVAKEFASRGITVNAVAPGFITTDMTSAMSDAAKQASVAHIPLGREGKAQEVAHAVAFLAAQESAYITGQVLCVDGGMAM